MLFSTIQAHDSSPENYRRRRICCHGSLENTSEMHQVWYIIAWCPAAISILECVSALVVLTGTTGIWRLHSAPAPLVQARYEWRCWWTPWVEIIKLNLQENSSNDDIDKSLAFYWSYCNTEQDFELNLQMSQIELTWRPLVWGQPLQEPQLTQRTSLPVSICTWKSLGGEPNLTFV